MEETIGFLNSENVLVRKCSQELCLNPLHYAVEKKKRQIAKKANMDEVRDLMTMIDLVTLEDLGFEEYLNSFNLGNPLPAQPLDFFVACNRLLKRAHRKEMEDYILEEI